MKVIKLNTVFCVFRYLDWSKYIFANNDIFANILTSFSEEELKVFASVCKDWCQGIALVINARKLRSPVYSCDIDLTGEGTSKITKAIRVVPSCFLKEKVIDLSSDAEADPNVIDLCAGEFPLL